MGFVACATEMLNVKNVLMQGMAVVGMIVGLIVQRISLPC